MTAAAMIDGTAGPGAHTRPSSSSTMAASARPKPDPPTDSGRWRPSQPNSTISPK